MMQRFRLKPVLILALSVLSACANPPLKISRQMAHDADFTGMTRFGFQSPAGSVDTDAAKKTRERLQLDQLIMGHIALQLKARGLRQDEQHPDLRVAWSFGEWAIDDHTPSQGDFGSRGPLYPGAHGSLIPKDSDGRAPPPSVDPYSHQHETARLEIRLMDPGTSRILWQAKVTDETDFGYFRSAQNDQIKSAIETLLEGFPPQGGGNPQTK